MNIVQYTGRIVTATLAATGTTLRPDRASCVKTLTMRAARNAVQTQPAMTTNKGNGPNLLGRDVTMKKVDSAAIATAHSSSSARIIVTTLRIGTPNHQSDTMDRQFLVRIRSRSEQRALEVA